MKKRTGKIFALLLSLTMAAGMLAGCGSDKTESTDAAAKTEAAQEGKKTFVFGDTTFNAENEEYQQIELLGKFALFTNGRLTDADIPQGLYCYHLRHSDDGGCFCSVEPKVGVNHGGSVITKEPLDFGAEGYIPFTDDTEPNFIGGEQTLGEFLRSDAPQEESEVMKLC